MFIALAPAHAAQAPSPWAPRAAVAAYVLPNDDDYIQPTVTLDRSALHLEGRYNYEDRKSVAGFVGWNHETGTRLALALTPMIGGVVGRTDGVIPALELTLGYGRLELYSEGEYVIDLEEASDSFLYNWSELSYSPTDWLTGGFVIQRSRTVQESRDMEPGMFMRGAVGKVEGTAHFFSPGSDDHYFVGSIGISF
jgi:hypothetical protein